MFSRRILRSQPFLAFPRRFLQAIPPNSKVCCHAAEFVEPKQPWNHEWISRHGITHGKHLEPFFVCLRVMKHTHGNMKGASALAMRKTYMALTQMDCPQWLPDRGFQRATFCVLVEAGHKNFPISADMGPSDWNCQLDWACWNHGAVNDWMTPLCHCAKTCSIGFSRTQNATDLAGKAVRLAKLRRPLILGWGRMKYLEKNGRAWRGSRRLSLSCTHVWGHQKEYGFNMADGIWEEFAKEWAPLRTQRHSDVHLPEMLSYVAHGSKSSTITTMPRLVRFSQLSQEYLPRESEYVLS